MLASNQHGVVSRSQLLAIGLGREAIARRLRSGRLLPLHPGVYAVGHRALSRRSQWIAAVLASEPGAVLSFRSAAALWRIRADWGGPIDVTVPRKSHPRGVIRRHYAPLPSDEITIRHGIPVTTVPRTIFDLASSSLPEAVEAMLREAEFRRLSDRLSLPALLDRYPGHRGSRSVRAALERLAEDPGGRIVGRLEERFLPFLARHRLPRPRFNAQVETPQKSYRVDCLWPQPG